MHKALIKTTLLLLGFALSVAPARASEWQFDGVSRIVAIADVHGAYDAMVEAMQSAEVVDADLSWVAGDAHLVIVGDLLDRGPDSRPAMDLLMQLEGEAEAAGGRVHVLIGNHEAMNLMGDMRYVSAWEYAAFADEEQPEERERWFAAYAQQRAPADQAPEALATVFRQKFPAGYFAHRRAFSSEGKYGEWLLSKPAIVVINRTAFVHGGLSPMVEQIGLQGVNGRLIGEMGDYVRHVERLYMAGVLLPTDNFHDHPAILARHMPGLDTSVDVLQSIEAVKKLNGSSLNALDGPLWYRGNVVCSELIEDDKLAGALEAIGADRVVIGHTPTPGRQVLERLDGKIIQIDTGMLNNYYGGSANALVIDADGVSAVNQDGTINAAKRRPRSVGTRPQGRLSSSQIESLLAGGEVVARRETESGEDIVTVSDGAATLEAVFDKRKGRGFYPEVAAYRLDTLINLEMVPVAVVREIDGDEGSLRFRPKNFIDELQRQEERSGGAAWCDLEEQWNAMFVFDALIYNEGRTGEDILYSLDFWQLMLVGHDSAFRARKGVPNRLQSVPYEAGEAWKDAAAELSKETLSDALGDVLDEKRVKALAARAEALATSD
ncbi:MAG: metallophosphoesterase [Woeseiaceae bacterium]|nr:metallophosphoesterase [Woeseiaceae bacterium]